MTSILLLHLLFVLFLTCCNSLPLSNSSFLFLPNNSTKSLLVNNDTRDHVENEQNTNVTDYCLGKNTMLERSECIQVLLEAYFGTHIAWTCPSLSLKFSAARCRGCPWNNLDPDMVRRENLSLPLPRSSFGVVERSCNFANLVSLNFQRGHPLEGYFTAGALIVISTIVITLLGASLSKRISFFGFTIPEAVYLGVLWLFYSGYLVLWIKILEYEIKCDNINSYYSTLVSSYFFGITTHAVSLLRCFRLTPRATCSCFESSWATFIADTFRNRKIRSRWTFALAIFCTLLPVLLLVDFIVEVFGGISTGKQSGDSICSAGLPDIFVFMWSIEMSSIGLSDLFKNSIQISKHVLQAACVIVYATRRSQNNCFRISRYVTLGIIFVLNFSIFVIMFTNLYRSREYLSLLPNVLDRHRATNFVEVFHTAIVTFFGLFEPVRIKHEKHRCGIYQSN